MQLARFLKRTILRDPFELEVRRWFKTNGDKTLRFDYELNSNSVVFDVGGYLGDFASQIHKKFGCNVWVFEPHPTYYELCVKRFEGYQNIRVLNFGLSNADEKLTLSDQSDGSSFMSNIQESDGILCELRKFSDVLEELGVRNVDLIKLNIEGGEFPLLNHILTEDLQSRIGNFQIQFHNFVDGAVEKRDLIASRLKASHEKTWCFEFVWENWRRK